MPKVLSIEKLRSFQSSDDARTYTNQWEIPSSMDVALLSNACACMGPLHGEPYCECEMKIKGLPLNIQAREEAKKRVHEGLKTIFQNQSNIDPTL